MAFRENQAHYKETKFCASTKCSVLVAVTVFVLTGVVVIVTFLAPFVRSPVTSQDGQLPWWKKEIIYQIYPRSFKDSNDDGVGDLPGIISKLDYFTYLKVGAVWLSPFYPSPMKDFGYDVSNYNGVDPIFGTLEDFDKLVSAAHTKGIKVIIDFVPNHTSDQHIWFNESRSGRTSGDKYRDYYIWSKGRVLNGKRIPPNNWQAVPGGSAWQWDDTAQAFYYHAYQPAQPDLNFRNPEVLKEMENILLFWLNHGVDGFRIDAIPRLFEAENLSLNEPNNDLYKPYSASPHPYIKDQPEIYVVVKQWADLLQRYSDRDGRERLLIAEASGINGSIRNLYYKADSIPFFFDLLKAKGRCGGRKIKEIILKGMDLPQNGWPNFVLGNHDHRRIASKWGSEYTDALNILLLTLPGTPTTYYGEEIGMTDVQYRPDELKDPIVNQSKNINKTRDPERSPMQWDSTLQSGFTSPNVRPWLRIHDNHILINVEDEKKSKNSHLNIYRTLSNLRKKEAFQNDKIVFATTDDTVLSYIRQTGTEKFLIVLNLGVVQVERDFSQEPVMNKYGKVEMATPMFRRSSKDLSKIDLTRISLKSGDGAVISVN